MKIEAEAKKWFSYKKERVGYKINVLRRLVNCHLITAVW